MIAYKYNSGGLLRCCTKTLSDAMAAAITEPPEGQTLQCRYCSNTGGGMVFKGGIWQWAGRLIIILMVALGCVGCTESEATKEYYKSIRDRRQRAMELCFSAGKLPVIGEWSGEVIGCKAP